MTALRHYAPMIVALLWSGFIAGGIRGDFVTAAFLAVFAVALGVHIHEELRRV